MNLKSLDLLIRVADRKSFTQAGKELGMTQPAVSHQILTLEEHYGVQLLDRAGREIDLTESGRVVYEYARKILALETESRQEIDRLNRLLRGKLVLGASTGPGEHVLPELLGRFKQRYPQIDVALRILPTDEIVESVLRRELEIGMVGAPNKNADLVFEPFVKDQVILIAPPGHRWAERDAISLEELLQEPFVLQQSGAGVRLVLEAGLEKLGLSVSDLNIFMELGLQESIKTAVGAGFGVGMISRFAVRQELRYGTLIQLPSPDLTTFREDFYTVRHRSKRLSLLVERFLEFAHSISPNQL